MKKVKLTLLTRTLVVMCVFAALISPSNALKMENSTNETTQNSLLSALKATKSEINPDTVVNTSRMPRGATYERLS
jgi:hypothetical protein